MIEPKGEETFALQTSPDTNVKEHYRQFFYEKTEEDDNDSIKPSIHIEDSYPLVDGESPCKTLEQTADFNKLLLANVN